MTSSTGEVRPPHLFTVSLNTLHINELTVRGSVAEEHAAVTSQHAPVGCVTLEVCLICVTARPLLVELHTSECVSSTLPPASRKIK